MLKKIIKIIISIIIVLFSFFYTNEVISFFRNKDPIMIEIKKNNEDIDIDKSYQIMKRVGKFDKNLLVFQESNSDELSFKKYISYLNKKNEVSLAFVLENNDNILSILSILKKHNINATFFVSQDIFDNSVDLIKTIYDGGNQIELLSNTYSVYEVNKYTSLLRIITKEKLKFCINSNDDKLLKSCESSKLYTISPKSIINNNLYLYVKKNLNDGLIIVVNNSNKIIKELSSTINYIKQKGKKFILLKSIIE